VEPNKEVIVASAFDQVARNGSNAFSSIMIQQIQHAAVTKQILTVPQFRSWLSARAFMFDKHGNPQLTSAPIHLQNYQEPRMDVKMAKRDPRVLPLKQKAIDPKLVMGALRRTIPSPINPSSYR
jgi:hypothetical protein